MSLYTWIMTQFLPIFVPAEVLQSLIFSGEGALQGWSIGQFVALVICLVLVFVPVLLIYFAIKRGRRLF